MTQHFRTKFWCLATFFGLFSIFFIENSFAARWASVVVNKAVVYSDVQMSSAIGYIKKGKRVRVGEVAKNKGRLLPVIINKRVAYIKIEDLNIATDIRTLQTVTERVRKAQNRKEVETSIGAYGGIYRFNTYRDKDFKEYEGDTDFQTMYGLGLVGYYRNLKRNFNLKVSLEAMRYEEDDTSITYYTVPVGYQIYTKEIGENSRVDLYGSLLLLPFIEAKFSDELILNGNGVGFGFDVEYVKKLNNKFNFHLEGNYSVIKQFGFDSGSDSALLQSIEDLYQGYFFGYKFLAKVSLDY